MATPDKIRIEQETRSQPTLFLAFELGQNTWKLGFTIGMAQQPRERTIPPGALDLLQQEIARAKQRFGLPEEARVVSCYEAGRDGFWLHRPWSPMASRTTSSIPPVLRSIGATAGRRRTGSMSASS